MWTKSCVFFFPSNISYLYLPSVRSNHQKVTTSTTWEFSHGDNSESYHSRLNKSQHTGCPGRGGLANTKWTQAEKMLYASPLLALEATQTKNWIHKENELEGDHRLPQQPPRHPQHRQVDPSSVPAWIWPPQETRYHARCLVPANPQGWLYRSRDGGAQVCEAAAGGQDQRMPDFSQSH